MQRLGWRAVDVPYYEWWALAPARRPSYMRRKLEAAGLSLSQEQQQQQEEGQQQQERQPPPPPQVEDEPAGQGPQEERQQEGAAGPPPVQLSAESRVMELVSGWCGAASCKAQPGCVSAGRQTGLAALH